MNVFAIALALFIMVNVGDRLRLINWHNARPWAVLVQLVQLGLGFWVLWDAFTSIVAWWQWVGLLLCLAWLHVTRHYWRAGVPPGVRTDHGELGQPELERFR